MKQKHKFFKEQKHKFFNIEIKRLSPDLLLIKVWIIMMVIFIITPILKKNIIRAIFGIPMIIFIPGYLLLSSLFIKKDDLDNIERIVLSLCLSVLVVALIGLCLNYTFGIRLIPIMISLAIFDILMIFITNYRRELLNEDQRFSFHFRLIYDKFIKEITTTNKIDRFLNIILTFSIILSIGMLIYIMTIPKTGEKLTEFYILNSSTGKADNYSKNLKIDSPSTLLVGVVNHEYSIVNYTIQINMDKNILMTREIKLDDNEKWEKNMTFVPNKKGDAMKLEFLLFKNKNFTEPYRELHLWENVTN